MTTINTQYLPANLGEHQLNVIMYLIQTPKAAKIIVALCDKKSSYLNAIQKIVGGSKSNTVEIIKALEALKIIKSDWKVENLKSKAIPKARAVKSFLLSDDKEKLIETYEPIFKKLQ